MALKNQDITIHGTGKQSRDLTYISDAVQAFLLAAKKKQCLKKVFKNNLKKSFKQGFKTCFFLKSLKGLTRVKKGLERVKKG